MRKLLGHRDIQTTQLYIKGLELYLENVRTVQANEVVTGDERVKNG